ncbi:sigma-70 domain-containing protein, partial [Spirosoma lituiforme]
YFRDKGWVIRVPRRIQNLYKKINVAKKVLPQELQRVPTIADIADYLGEDEETILETMEASKVYTPQSLDMKYTVQKGENAIDLAEEILDTFSEEALLEIEVEELTKINGIKEAKASKIIASLQLGKRIKENISIFDFDLSQEDMNALASLGSLEGSESVFKLEAMGNERLQIDFARSYQTDGHGIGTRLE